MKKFNKKIVLITGGARGMGQEHIKQFLKEGAFVYFTDVLEKEGKELEESLGENVKFIKQDVSSEKAWLRVVSIIEKDFGKLDILINNAAIIFNEYIKDMSLEDYMRVIEVNQASVFLGMKHCLELLKKGENANIVNISSINGFRTSPKGAAYASSKFAIRALSQVAAQEFADFNIRVNTICPGSVDTQMVYENSSKAQVKKGAKETPLKRIAQPEELSKVVMFVCSEDSSFMTGAEIVADGGSLICK